MCHSLFFGTFFFSFFFFLSPPHLPFSPWDYCGFFFLPSERFNEVGGSGVEWSGVVWCGGRDNKIIYFFVFTLLLHKGKGD